MSTHTPAPVQARPRHASMRSVAAELPNIDRFPVAYLRKSRTQDEERELSDEMQKAGITEMILMDGQPIEHVVWLEDWGKSGSRHKLHLRYDYAEVGTVEIWLFARIT